MKDNHKIKEHFYETESGERMPILPVSLVDLQLAEQGLREEYQARGEPLDPPKFKIQLGPDGKAGEQEMEHDETTLRTDEDRAAWAAYQDATARFNRERAQIIQEIIFEDGIPVQIPADGTWEAKMKRRRVKLPDDLEAKRTQYILSHYLKTPQDIKGAIAEVMLLSAKGHDNQAAIKASLESFLGLIPAENRIDGSGEAAG